MARQSSIIKLKGTIGGVTFYKTKDGYLAKEKSEVEKSKIKNDPAFQRTRENSAEFGTAGKAGKVLRRSIVNLMKTASDYRVVSRLAKEMIAVLRQDDVNVRGERTVTQGDLLRLQGFDFNTNAKLGATFTAPYTVSINRTTGEAKVDIEAFVPENALKAPAGATHYRFLSAAMEVDFANETFNSQIGDHTIQPWNYTEVPAKAILHELTEESTLPLFVVLGIEFFQNVNGEMYSLKNGSHNALQLVGVDNA